MPRSTVTVAEAFGHFQLRRINLARSTQTSTNNTVAQFVAWHGPDKQVGTITTRVLEEYFITGPKARILKVKPSTFNVERQRIGQFIKFGASRGYWRSSIIEDIDPLGVEERHRIQLNAEQLRFAMDFQKHPRDRFIIALGANVGLRASEAAALQLKHVDLRGGLLYVRRIKQKKVDVLTINPDLDMELRVWLRWYTEKVGELLPDMRLIPARVRSEIVAGPKGVMGIVYSDDIRPFDSSYNYIRIPVHKALKELGLPTEYEGLHTLRRSAAKLFYLKCLKERPGEDAARLTQTFLQHSSLEITERYLGIQRERLIRDEIMSLPFLSTMTSDENVVQLRPAMNDGFDLNSYLKEQ